MYDRPRSRLDAIPNPARSSASGLHSYSSSPTITNLSVTTGGIGTLVTISGFNFGGSQGASTVSFNGVAATVISWTDGVIVVRVPEGVNPGSATVAVNIGGAASNTQAFTVTPPLIVTPSAMTLVIGEDQSMQIIDPSGALLTGATWQLDDSTVADLVSTPGPQVTAKALGQTKLRAFLGDRSGEATVTVVAARQPGDVKWSVPGDGSAVKQIIPAVPAEGSSVDVFSLQASGNLLAIAADGTISWVANVGQPKSLLPDFQGGIVALYNTAMVRLKQTGETAVNYAYNNFQYVPRAAVHTDGTIFTIDGAQVVGIDSATGNVKFSVAMNAGTYFADDGCNSDNGPVEATNMPQAGNPVIAGDGNLYLPYLYVNSSYKTYAQYAKPSCRRVESHSDGHFHWLRVSADGASVDLDMADWSADTNWDWACGGDPDCSQQYWVETDIENNGFVPVLNWVDPITNSDKGAMLSWILESTQGDVSHLLTTFDANGVTSQTNLNLGQTWGDAVWWPYLQRSDGSYVGFGEAAGVWSIAAVDPASGNALWSAPVPTRYDYGQPQYVLADGSVVTQQVDDNNNIIEVTYDAQGNVVPSAQGADAIFSWTGEAYRYGSVENVEEEAPEYDMSFAATQGGGPSGGGTYVPSLKGLYRSTVATKAKGYVGNATRWQETNGTTCNLFVRDVLTETAGDVGVKIPAPVRPNLAWYQSSWRHPFLAADWANPNVRDACWKIVSGGPDASKSGDVVATGYPSNTPDTTGHVGIVVDPDAGFPDYKDASAADVPPYWWTASQKQAFVAGTITLTDYGFRLPGFDFSDPTDNQGLKRDSHVRRFKCY